MKKVLVVAAVVAALVWVVKSQGRYSWGQKLTVTVETPAGVIAVPEAQYPMLVTLGDMADPASVRLVDPGDLAASFGQGVRLKAVTLELTGEAVTKGVVGGCWVASSRTIPVCCLT